MRSLINCSGIRHNIFTLAIFLLFDIPQLVTCVRQPQENSFL